ncbi:efflux RND transporter permease subunit [Parahaliea aestuarii]|uniref:Efflux RND transporter permease subunit n=1 Tax=Parahaliea aestuarii TaxID=1852021 RepID=A0A5C8ZMM3_9GAMM|nr:efflux RND transporter permease subunit [Parahaliea aestuarii]TXS89733.1 efflux RND transporter permease subunit [Parahaliea aestuarii]
MSSSSPGSETRAHYLIDTFTRHPLAANLLMMMLVLAGIWGLRQLTVQLNPPQPSHSVSVDISWPGAAAEDVELLITQPVEYQLRSLQHLKSLTSTTLESHSSIRLEFERGTDMGLASDRVKQQVAQTRDLPADMETPVVSIHEPMETVAALLLAGTGSLSELAPLARDIESQLLARGIDQVEFRGVPEEEIAIQVDSKTLYTLGLPLGEIARRILDNSADVPAGSAGSGQLERKLRSLEQRRSAQGFAELPLSTGDGEQLVRLGDIADIERRERDHQRHLQYQGKPAITLILRRAAGSDIMGEADILHQWYAENRASLEQQGVQSVIWLEAWRFAKETLMLVVNNGIGGLLLVVATLYLFLNARVAGWVTAGIPVSFLGALAVFHFLGGSINFISLVGAVMALGIVVDDAIVVGEHALSRFEAGASPEQAAAQGAQHMFAPVMASSLTTLAAFLPLIVLDEPFIREIPLLMVCVIIASLIECFLIMPGHLRHSFQAMQKQPKPSRFRTGFERRFNHFRDAIFSPLLLRALDNRRAVLALSLGAFVVALTLLASGRVKPELNISLNFEFADAYLQFSAGASEADKQAVLEEMERTLLATNEAFGGNVIVTHVPQRNWAMLEQQPRTGPQYAALWVELVPPNEREVSLAEFSAAWQERVTPSPYVETLHFSNGEDNWPDLQLYFSGADVTSLKAAAEELAGHLARMPGVNNVFDDLPYGKEQWVFSLTTEGRAAGLTSADIGRQLRAAYEGYRLQIFTEDRVELEVRLSLPARERFDLASIGQLPISTPAGTVLPLSSVAEVGTRRGIERINHRDARQVINVYGSVDRKQNTPMAVIAELEESVIPEITRRYGVTYGLGERSAEEAATFHDMLLGAVIGLLLIYLILAWIFASWSWPLAVMLAIPLGLTGALAGLQLMDLNLGAMAIMGLFTLTGVIVNDSIILINAYKAARDAGQQVNEALLRACRSRLRPVLLTSLTTAFGLAPMMLESSPIGQVMAPLAVVICFGLLYGSTLILFTIPAVLSLLESLSLRLQRRRGTRISPSSDIAGVTP